MCNISDLEMSEWTDHRQSRRPTWLNLTWFKIQSFSSFLKSDRFSSAMVAVFLNDNLFWPLCGLTGRTASEMTGDRMRGRGVTRSKGPQAGTPARGHCREDKASVHGTPTLPEDNNYHDPMLLYGITKLHFLLNYIDWDTFNSRFRLNNIGPCRAS